MKSILTFLNGLGSEQQELFARRCGTSVNYLRKSCYTKQRLGAEIAIALERESGGEIRLEDVRPDLDWAYVRGTSR